MTEDRVAPANELLRRVIDDIAPTESKRQLAQKLRRDAVAEAASLDSDELRKALHDLANEAARAVTEPRRFHENEDDRQQALGHEVGKARGLLLALLSVGDKAAPTHRFDHDGTYRHHHHDQTHEAVWWLNVEQFGGEKREHNHGAGDKAEAPPTTEARTDGA